MDKDALVRRLMKTFLSEFDDHLAALNRDLMVLERGPESSEKAEVFKRLFRTAHSLKGASRSVDIDVLERAGHHLESIFEGLRGGSLNLDAKLFELLFAAVDAIKDIGHRLTAGNDIAESPLLALLPALQSASGGTGPARPTMLDVAPIAGEATAASPSGTATKATSPTAPATRDRFVRVRAEKLDHMLTLGGELLIARRHAEGRSADVTRLLEVTKAWAAESRAAEGAVRGLARRHGNGKDPSPAGSQALEAETRGVDRTKEDLQWLTGQLEQLAASLAADQKEVNRTAALLEQEVQWSRMVPFAEACEGLDRAIRDLAKTGSKEVSLAVEGAVEIDRSVVQGLKDPLLHLVRNAVDHGIELPAERSAAGKPARGQIRMSAALRNGQVEVVVADDGRGFDLEAIREGAIKRGLPVPSDDLETARLVFTPGFSTSSTVTEISGRGVGLDIVKAGVESLRGDVKFTFQPGQGTRFVLTVPLTLTRLPALLVRVGSQTYAFDSAAVRTLLRVSADELRSMEGRDVLTFDGTPVPIVSLAAVLGQPVHEVPHAGGKVPVVVLGTGAGRAAFTVDELVAEQEVVVKDLGPRLLHVNNVMGATVLPTGQLALILNAAELVRATLGQTPTQMLSVALAEQPSEAKKHLLVVDDSVTTRTLVQSILEAAGYEVTTAADGMEAWQILREKEADLVVSDVEMPRMDGCALTEAIRGSKRLRSLPVILVTALESEQDKVRGLDAGADAYLVKSAFDQTNLIHAIERLL